METAEHREPYELRGSRTDLGAPGGESPPGRTPQCKRDRAWLGLPVRLWVKAFVEIEDVENAGCGGPAFFVFASIVAGMFLHILGDPSLFRPGQAPLYGIFGAMPSAQFPPGELCSLRGRDALDGNLD